MTTTGASPASPAPIARPAQDEGGGGTSLKGAYDEILGRETELIAQIERSRAEQTRLSADLVDLQAEVVAKQEELLRSQQALDLAEATSEAEAAKRREAEARTARAEERLRKQIVASYVSGGATGGALEAILRADNGEDAGNALAYTQAVVGDTDRVVRDLLDARAEQRRIAAEADAARTRAATQREKVGDATTFLTAALERQRGLVAEVNQQVVVEQTALNEVKGQKAKIEGDIASLNRTSDGIAVLLADFQAGQPEWVAGSVTITNPIPGYAIGSKFGQRKHPILGTTRLHAGGDMGAPSGEVIYAPADGIVVVAGTRGGYGNATVIDHGFSLATLYGHQSRIDVEAGQAVKRGDPIGLVGSTGLSTGPHLHFETRLKGVPTDPELIVDFTRPLDSYEAERRRTEELLATALAAQAGN